MLLAGLLATATALPANAADLHRAGPTHHARAKVSAGPIVGGIVANTGNYAYGPYVVADPLAAPAPRPWPGPVVRPGVVLPVPPGCFVARRRIWTEYGWRWRTAPICY
ncbi:hypothetical protein A33M_3808 [Rhodovulum sp. PH10]|uniref:hypothetical protein n=1 Tax=Rhodovulum sp. PH10 TaxID=1187851 RepID=UPI00027C25BF|nr:hypothetical protein [Rhodovulum sp. PH10]EJW13388.1 hypothetical protein A33M_3808 [Rhodovulum sp. PH10]